MQRATVMGYNTRTKKVIPWQVHLEKVEHVVKVHGVYDTETRKFKVLKKLEKSDEKETVAATISANDIQADLAKQEEAAAAKKAHEQALVEAASDNSDNGDVDKINKELGADEAPPAAKFARPKVEL